MQQWESYLYLWYSRSFPVMCQKVVHVTLQQLARSGNVSRGRLVIRPAAQRMDLSSQSRIIGPLGQPPSQLLCDVWPILHNEQAKYIVLMYWKH